MAATADGAATGWRPPTGECSASAMRRSTARWAASTSTPPSSLSPPRRWRRVLEVASDGGVFAFGDAGYFGSMGGRPLNKPVVGSPPRRMGRATGKSPAMAGSLASAMRSSTVRWAASNLNQPIVGIAADRASGGYWEVASDGGVFSFGAPFFGSTGSIHLNRPVVAITASPDGKRLSIRRFRWRYLRLRGRRVLWLNGRTAPQCSSDRHGHGRPTIDGYLGGRFRWGNLWLRLMRASTGAGRD